MASFATRTLSSKKVSHPHTEFTLSWRTRVRSETCQNSLRIIQILVISSFVNGAGGGLVDLDDKSGPRVILARLPQLVGGIPWSSR
jgi:hypothetical protein